MWRDFTHVDDVTDAIISVMSDNPETHEIYNVCNFKPIRIYDLVKIIEQETGIKADIDSLPLQPGEIRRMCGDNYKIEKKYGWQPKVNIKEGIKELIEWIKEYELKKEKP
jgi:UDP-glucuronate 4-epimerase